MEFTVGHNGTTTLPLKENERTVYPDAPLSEVHDSAKEIVRNQIEHGIHAERCGFDQLFFTEHHFQITGAEFSTNPLMSLMYVAAKTDEIKLLQLANILPWHDPVRLAEQTSILDVMSDGRAEVGIGRGYIPREAETLGQYWGGTVQDQEKNRAAFEEKFEIMRKAWTQDLFSHNGQYHHVPPAHTQHDYDQDRDYLADEATEYEVDDVFDDDDGASTLDSLSVFPQPLQEPHPQVWQPTLSDRSIKWAARQGVNSYSVTGTIDDVRHAIDLYYDEAEEAGWPDHRPEYDGEEFRRGWDEDRRRGVVTRKFVFDTEVADEETFERWKKGRKMAISHLVSLGFFDYETAMDRFSTDSDSTVFGDAEDIIESIVETKEEAGYDDFIIGVTFEAPGLTEEEQLTQMDAFSEKVMPYLHEEYPSP